jgi:hypothetical protein
LGLATIAALLLAPAAATAAAPRGAAQKLIDAYAPITKVREEQVPPCETSAEQYAPTSVETVLGNPEVILERDVPGEGLEAIHSAPTAAGLAGLGPSYYLNLRGDPLGDTCVYARDFQRLRAEGRAPIVTYAHIARETGHPGFALQYWFYWYFNQSDDPHESDWDGMQIAFDAETPKQALEEDPSEVILFQHDGGERADWNGGKLEKVGTHPVVYPAAGSHAIFYGSNVYVEKDEHGSGLSCANTTEPLEELKPHPILLPEQVTASGPFAWLRYDGHWGQREKGRSNGPTGPRTTAAWSEPFTWMEAQRTSSVRVSAAALLAPQATDALCATAAVFSDLLELKAEGSTGTVVWLIILLALLAFFVGFTRWSPVEVEQLRARRAFGQLARSARQLYGRHWLAMIGTAVAAVPIVRGTHFLVRLFISSSSEVAGTVADLLDCLSWLTAMAIVSAVVIFFVRSLAETGDAETADAWRGMVQRFWRLVGAPLLAALTVLALAITLVGIPLAIWLAVRWALVQQEIVFHDTSVDGAFRDSARLVRGRWLHTFRAVLFFGLVGLIGPVLHFALLFSALPLAWVDWIGAAVFALLIPYLALGYTLLFFDLEARAGAEPSA